ncbi:MAG TPA: type II CAAX endopeptidase family protein, partial [Pyrinomonadaceae bacterium]|nr:type II CAAX endopeptidase family protein [Pyrinomonadaceae bacterium]
MNQTPPEPAPPRDGRAPFFSDALRAVFFKIYFNDKGRLRSGWRLLIFAALFFFVASFVQFAVFLAAGGRDGAVQFFETVYGDALNRVLLLAVVTGVGWLCGYVLESLPPRALGWSTHRGWLRDFAFGSLVGIGTLLLAVLAGTFFGGYSFSLAGREALPAVFKTLALAAAFFVVAGAAEEALFRGYPLQTLLRSVPAWVPLLLTAVLFGAVHLSNPNASPGLPFVNTVLAGVWLAAAYLRTRSLWFPTGVHWAWNWTLGPVVGLPVSGLKMLSRDPLVQAADRGPAWLTGGDYGVEGGAICTVALLLSTLFIWRTRLLRADPELKRLTD